MNHLNLCQALLSTFILTYEACVFMTPIYWCVVGGEELGTEKWSNEAKITQVVSGEARLRTQALWFSLHGAAA